MHIFFTLLSTIFLFSCSSFIFPDFKIEDFSKTEDSVTITFSSTPAQNSLINSFSFTQDGEIQKGSFYFTDSKMTFTPLSKIKKNHDYKIIITTDAEDTNGISLLQNYVNEFSTKPHNNFLSVIDAILSTDCITISFSEKVKRESFSTAFSITPEEDYIQLWNSDNTQVQLKFLSSLSSNTRFYIEIKDSLQDEFNNTLKTDFTYSFLNAPDNISSAINLYESNNSNLKLLQPVSQTFSQTNLQTENFLTNENINTTSDLKLTFSKPIPLDTISTKIQIFPKTNFSLIKTDSISKDVTIHFDTPPAYNSTLTLELTNLTDINSNKIENQKYILHYNNPQNRPPIFQNGIIQLSNNSYHFSRETYFKTIIFPVDLYPTINTQDLSQVEFILLFSISKNAENILYTSAIENINITSTNNCMQFMPVFASLLSQEEINNSFPNQKNTDTDSKFSAIKFTYHVKNNDNIGLIKLSISEKLSDTLGNQSSTYLTFPFNKQ